MQKIESQTLNQLAYEQLRAELTSGSFKPEQPLVARTLASSLGILDLPGFCGERLAHFPGFSLEGDWALEAER